MKESEFKRKVLAVLEREVKILSRIADMIEELADENNKIEASLNDVWIFQANMDDRTGKRVLRELEKVDGLVSQFYGALEKVLAAYANFEDFIKRLIVRD
jgi:hypothetical protein